jgi:tetratricopeptide (TPR) repeat protein
MKSSIVILSICIILVAGIVVYLGRQKVPLTSTPIAESASSQTTAHLEKIAVSQKAPPRVVSMHADERVQVAATPVKSDNPIDSTPFSKAIDTLVSPQASFQEKQAALKQLHDAGQLDQAIEALKQGAANNPASAEYPAALGQAELQKAGVISQNGGSINEMGILGMQADQNFDAALKLDPSNWEAQFFKAAAMSYWPLELNKGQEVVQRLSNLIDQQDTMTLQPQFAQTYILLGNQYQKMGRTDYAEATWQLGATKFPNDPTLQKKISGL